MNIIKLNSLLKKGISRSLRNFKENEFNEECLLGIKFTLKSCMGN